MPLIVFPHQSFEFTIEDGRKHFFLNCGEVVKPQELIKKFDHEIIGDLMIIEQKISEFNNFVTNSLDRLI